MNKTTAIILCVATFIAGEVVGFLFGRAIGRSNPPVQLQDAANASADAAQEISRRSAAEADAFRTFARQRS